MSGDFSPLLYHTGDFLQVIGEYPVGLLDDVIGITFYLGVFLHLAGSAVC